MALQQTVVLSRIRELVAECTGLERVYGASESDENSIPEAAIQFPCAFVVPGETQEYMLSAGQHRHTYGVVIQILNSPGMFSGQAYAALAPYVDLVIEKFAVNTTLGQRVNSCLFQRSSGIQFFPSGDIEYPGVEITIRVSEQAQATPAPGA